MDQPYSRLIDMMFDRQYYNAADTRPYDDTGWSFGPLKNVTTHRITDRSILNAPMTILLGTARAPGGVRGTGPLYVIPHTADNILATFRYRLKDIAMQAAEEGFEVNGRRFAPGSLLIPESDGLRERLDREGRDLGVEIYAADGVPSIKTHPAVAARLALVHTWLSTQTEGWFRIALDKQQIPYEYISDQKLREIADLKSKYDVIIFGPTPGATQRIVNGIPKHGDAPIPFKKSDLTPTFGQAPDQAEDIRGGMGLEGLLNIRRFVEAGGVMIWVGANASIPIDMGLVEGVTIAPTPQLNAKGSVLLATVNDATSPLAYGYGKNLAVYFNQTPAFQISPLGGAQTPAPTPGRTSGRGGPSDPDVPQARPFTAPMPPPPPVKPGEEPPLSDEMREFMRPYLTPEGLRPRVVLRFAEERDLLVSGMLAGGRELAGRAAVIDVPRGQGHHLLFANNPMWRHGTQGSFFLIFNALMNAGHLHVRGAANVNSSSGQ
jgi:hypothetical protein